MQPQKPKPYPNTHVTLWQDFIQRGMNIITQNPTIAKYVMKYDPKRHIFILKITDGTRMVLKKCKASQQYEQIEKVTVLIGKVLTNQSQEKKEHVDPQTQMQKQKKKKKKKNK